MQSEKDWVEWTDAERAIFSMTDRFMERYCAQRIDTVRERDRDRQIQTDRQRQWWQRDGGGERQKETHAVTIPSIYREVHFSYAEISVHVASPQQDVFPCTRSRAAVLHAALLLFLAGNKSEWIQSKHPTPIDRGTKQTSGTPSLWRPFSHFKSRYGPY